MSILYSIIGWIMKLCYSISFNNYILTLFIFAIVMQVILFPFGIKQQKSSVKLAKIKPKEMAIRNKYKGRNDRATQQKMQMEIQEMYKAEGYSPTAGCLPLLIQLPIIFALFGVVRMPLTYTTSLDNEKSGKSGYAIEDFFEEAWIVADNQIAAYESKLSDPDISENKIKEKIEYREKIKTQITNNVASDFTELELIKFMQNDVDEFKKDFSDENGKFNPPETGNIYVVDANVKSDGDSYAERLFSKENKTAASEEAVYDFNDMLAEKGITDKSGNNANGLPNFSFIGTTTTLDQPSYTSFNWLLIVPVLVFLSSFFSSEISRKLTTQPASDPNQPNPANSGFMRWMMPLMSTFFSFSFPAAIGIYWVFRSIASVGQQFLLCKLIPAPKYTEEEMKKAISEVKQAKKRKKLVTIEVDEDDTSYDDLAISEEKAEKIRRRRERAEEEAKAEREMARANRQSRGRQSQNDDSSSGNVMEKPILKDDEDRKE